MFEELTSEATFTRIEEEVWRFWRRYDVPEAFHASPRAGSPFVLSQQPSSAVGEALIDWVQVLVASDVLVRYRRMRGEAIYRSTGWICHGLPVEVAVERTLGPDVIDYDMAQFNNACRQAVLDGVQRAEALAERLHVRPSTISRWTRRGKIPVMRLTPKVIRYDLAAVLSALTEQCAEERSKDGKTSMFR